MLNFKFKSISSLALSALVAIGLGLSTSPAIAAEEDKKEGQRVVKVDCNRGDDVQRVLETYANEIKILVLLIEGVCESDEPVEVTRNNVEFVGVGETGGYITGVLEVEGGRGVYIGDNMILDNLIVEYGQVFLDAGEGLITIMDGVGVNFQSVLTISAEELGGSVIVDVNAPINLLNQSLLLIQQDEFASAGSVTTGNINASLQSTANVRAATIGEIGLASDSHVSLDGDVLWNGNGPGPLGRVFCDNQSRIWGPVNGAQFDVTGCMDI